MKYCEYAKDLQIIKQCIKLIILRYICYVLIVNKYNQIIIPFPTFYFTIMLTWILTHSETDKMAFTSQIDWSPNPNSSFYT